MSARRGWGRLGRRFRATSSPVLAAQRPAGVCPLLLFLALILFRGMGCGGAGRCRLGASNVPRSINGVQQLEQAQLVVFSALSSIIFASPRVRELAFAYPFQCFRSMPRHRTLNAVQCSAVFVLLSLLVIFVCPACYAPLPPPLHTHVPARYGLLLVGSRALRAGLQKPGS